MQKEGNKSVIYCKNLATGVYGKILHSTEEQIMAAIDGSNQE
jgi:hypothetical protein